jgi:protein TonB
LNGGPNPCRDEGKSGRTENRTANGTAADGRQSKQLSAPTRRFDSDMYRPVPTHRERAATVTAVVLVHLALAYALLNLSGAVRLPLPDELTQLIDVTAEPPPPPIVEIEQVKEKPKKKEGAASAKNIESQATPVVAPKPVIPVPSPQPIVASETPRTGTQATQGASDVVGPGTGAGGSGTGTGSGGSGTGTGGGGDGLAATRTRLETRPLRGRDFPDWLLDAWPPGAWIRMRFRIDANGGIEQCIVDQGTGNPAIDNQICAIARQRLRYRPALNRSGQRVADWAGYGQEPPR